MEESAVITNICSFSGHDFGGWCPYECICENVTRCASVENTFQCENREETTTFHTVSLACFGLFAVTTFAATGIVAILFNKKGFKFEFELGRRQRARNEENIT